MGEKLTKAQRRELEDLATREWGQHYDDTYKPIIALLQLGYVDRKDARYSTNGIYSITPAGRAALSLSEGGK